MLFTNIKKNMTPKEIALDLYNKFYNVEVHSNSVEVRSKFAKDCALICMKEIIEYLKKNYESKMVHFYETGDYEFYKKVIIEIEKINQ